MSSPPLSFQPLTSFSSELFSNHNLFRFDVVLTSALVQQQHTRLRTWSPLSESCASSGPTVDPDLLPVTAVKCKAVGKLHTKSLRKKPTIINHWLLLERGDFIQMSISINQCSSSSLSQLLFQSVLHLSLTVGLYISPSLSVFFWSWIMSSVEKHLCGSGFTA